MEGDYKDVEQQLEIANKVKEDSLRQLKKLQVSLISWETLFKLFENHWEKPLKTG